MGNGGVRYAPVPTHDSPLGSPPLALRPAAPSLSCRWPVVLLASLAVLLALAQSSNRKAMSKSKTLPPKPAPPPQQHAPTEVTPPRQRAPARAVRMIADGYCDTTSDGQGEQCRPQDSKGTWRIGSRQACLARCVACAQCHYISFSEKFSDCSWFRTCDLSGLSMEHSSSHVSMQVRHDNGTVCYGPPGRNGCPPPRLTNTASFPDLHKVGAFEKMLASTASRDGHRDVILLVADGHHANWAHNFILNLRELHLSHFLVIAASQQACAALDARVGLFGRCGHSTYLRAGHNASIDHGLREYAIRDSHVYHLWWQRVHYMARAVALGYHAFIMDTDTSLRADPYPVLRGPLRHRPLVFGLDNDFDGAQNLGEFPGINCGWIYCAGRPGGAAHAVIARWARRMEELLAGEIVRNTEGGAVFHMMFDQDTWKDLLETAAFRPPPSSYRASEFVAAHNVSESYRHVMYYAALSPPELQPLARRWKWQREHVVVHRGMPPEEVLWLPLHHPAPGSPSESVAGLPYSVFSGYNCEGRTGTPQGNRCDGGWAAAQSPVMVGHLVGVDYKFFLMRLLGWWHSEVDVTPTVTGPRVFPPHVRLLGLRGRHGLRLTTNRVHETFAAVARFMWLAFLLGRRAVLPMLPCELAAARQHYHPDTSLFDVAPLAEPSLCSDAARAHEWLPPVRVPPAFTFERVQARETTARGDGVGVEACCQLVPRLACIDGTGTHRHLHEELALHERDHALLMSELPPSAPKRALTTFASLMRDMEPTDPSPGAPALVVDGADLEQHLPSLATLQRLMERDRGAYQRAAIDLPHVRGCVRDMRRRIRASGVA